MPATSKPPSSAYRARGESRAAASARGAPSTATSVRSGVATERILRETFNQLSKGRSGYISVNLIGQALRMNNQCPTEAELDRIVQDYTSEETIDVDGEAKIDFDDFCEIMRENWKTRDQLLEEISGACNAFDKGQSGTLSAEELKTYLTSLGEVVDEAEVAEMLKDAGAVDGKVSHSSLAKLLLDAYSTPSVKKSAKKAGGAASARIGASAHKSSQH